MASVPLGDRGRADAALEQLTNAAKTIPDQDAREVAAIMAVEVEGLIKLGRNDRPGALAALARAAALEAKRPRPVARPYPIKPAGELYAEILLGTGDARAAVVQFKTALARTPGRAAVAARPGQSRERRRPEGRVDQGREGLPRRVASRRQRSGPSSPRCARWHDNATQNDAERHRRHAGDAKIVLREFRADRFLFRDLRGDRVDQISSMTISCT